MNRRRTRRLIIGAAIVIVYVSLAWCALEASLTVKYELSPPAVELESEVLDIIIRTVDMLTTIPIIAFTAFLLVLFLTRKKDF